MASPPAAPPVGIATPAPAIAVPPPASSAADDDLLGLMGGSPPATPAPAAAIAVPPPSGASAATPGLEDLLGLGAPLAASGGDAGGDAGGAASEEEEEAEAAAAAEAAEAAAETIEAAVAAASGDVFTSPEAEAAAFARAEAAAEVAAELAAYDDRAADDGAGTYDGDDGMVTEAELLEAEMAEARGVAAELLEGLGSGEEVSEADAALADEQHARGVAANQQRDFAGAAAWFEAAQRLRPTASELLSVANMHLKLGDGALAAALYEALLNADASSLGINDASRQMAQRKLPDALALLHGAPPPAGLSAATAHLHPPAAAAPPVDRDASAGARRRGDRGAAAEPRLAADGADPGRRAGCATPKRCRARRRRRRRRPRR